MAEPASLAPLLTRDGIPGYEIRGEIHCGGQGTVYVARQLAANRDVALKVLARGRGAYAQERKRFEREIYLACRLQHPGIARVYESGVHEGRAWYSMELIEGEPLDRWLRDNQLDRDARLDLIRSVVEAVAHAHRRGVIHRDLKPANVVVDRSGAPRLVDFGLALGMEESVRLTATGEFLGTLAYAAPEQVLGQETDTRTDVHALGLLLFEAMTGRLPWRTDGTVTELLDRVANEEPADPRQLSRDVDGELYTILMTALSKDPARRYDSADALLRDLRHHAAREPLDARSGNTLYVLNRFAVRHRVRIAVVLALAVLGTITLRETWRRHQLQGQVELAQNLVRAAVGTGDPMGSDRSQLAVLEESLMQLEDQLQDSPEVHAELLLGLGQAHASRLNFAQAEAHLRRAVDRFREAGVSEGSARALGSLAGVLAERGEAEAVQAAEQALDLRRSGAGDGVAVSLAERTLARALLARLPRNEADRERGRLLLESAWVALQDQLPADHPELAATRVLRAFSALSPIEAVDEYARALTVLEREAGGARWTIECLDHYSMALARMGRLDEANEMLSSLGDLTRQTYGEAHTSGHLMIRAMLERQRGDYPAALLMARNGVATELEAWSSKQPELASELERVATSIRGDDSPAWPRAFELLRELRGRGDFALSSWMNGIAETLDQLGQREASEALLRESLEIYCRAYGLDCPNRMRTLFLLAEHLAARGQPGEAMTCLEELLDRLHESPLQNKPFALEARDLLAELQGGLR